MLVNKQVERIDKEYVTIYIELELLRRFEQLLLEQGIKSRSNAICQLIQQYITTTTKQPPTT